MKFRPDLEYAPAREDAADDALSGGQEPFFLRAGEGAPRARRPAADDPRGRRPDRRHDDNHHRGDTEGSRPTDARARADGHYTKVLTMSAPKALRLRA